MSEAQRHAVEARLARIEGHVHGLHRMAHEGRPYPELVHQIAAVRSSQDSVLRAIVEDLVEECVDASPSTGSVVPIVEELRAVVDRAL